VKNHLLKTTEYSQSIGRYDNCIGLPKMCLADADLPEKYIKRFCIMLIGALNNWDEASEYLRMAEHRWLHDWSTRWETFGVLANDSGILKFMNRPWHVRETIDDFKR
jgi:hypothetical protein